MNAIGEFDLELLADYLDDALSPAQVEHVAQRLASEPELASAMHELRAERVLRSATWRSMEPSDAAATAFADRVCAQIRRSDTRQSTRRKLQIGSAVAAVLAIFVAGWLLRGPTNPAAKQTRQSKTPAVDVRHAIAIGESAGPFGVAVVDGSGRVVPVQKFSKADEARQFAHELAQYQARARDAEQGSAMLVSDHF